MLSETEASLKATQMVRRLTSLVGLRTLYQDLLKAELLLGQSTPIYEPLTAEEQEGMEEEEAAAAQSQRTAVAVEIVGEMQLTADELDSGLRALLPGFGAVYEKGSEVSSERKVRDRVKEVVSQLRSRATEEVALLPFPSVRTAQSAVDSRNARYTGRSPTDSLDETAGPQEGDKVSPIAKLGAAEKAAEKFVQKLQPAVKKVRESSPKDLVANVKAGATYAQGLWDRLNGGEAGKIDKRLPEGLALPSSTKEERQASISELSLEVSSLEKQLQEASKAREAKLRKADISVRARMAPELRKLDDEVSSLSRALAVRSLQLEMQYIYGALEEEALDNCVGKPEGLLNLGRRSGDDDELALLSAEFALLEESLVGLAQLVDRGSAIIIDEDELLTLATDVPDLRVRLGITDDKVFGGSGFSFLKLQLQLRESVRKVQEGVEFGSRGVRLLGSDVVNAVQLFWRAALGDTLKPREVQALRRTVRDILTFIPFTIILIAPITPVGHVLVFGFVQRYFPGFFPSQFSSRRQEIMTRYEQLQKELNTAQDQAIEAAEQAELAQAAAAVARLTAPRFATAAAGPAGAVSTASPTAAAAGPAAATSAAPAAAAGAVTATAAAAAAAEAKMMDAAAETGIDQEVQARVEQLKEAVAQAEEDTLLPEEDEEGEEGGAGHSNKQQRTGKRKGGK